MNDDKPKGSSQDTSQRTSHLVFASHLDIQDYTGHQDYQPPTLTTDDYYLARSTKWEPIYLPITSYGIPHLATNRTILPFSLPLRRFMYHTVPSVVASYYRCERCQYHGSIISCTSNSDCIHCFCNIPQTTEFYFCCLYSTGIHPPTPLL